MILISIIIPTYNSQRTIKECLYSVLEQSFQNFEIIIQDGKSTDGTLEIAGNILREFPNKEVYIKSESDYGIYDAMNKGITNSSGQWIYFLGSDDILYDKFVLEKLSKQIPKTKSPVIYGNVIISGNTGWANDGDIYDGYFNLGKILTKNICHQSIFYRKKIFGEMGNYNIRYNVCADYDFNLRCFAKYRFYYVDIIISKFHGGGTSIINNDINFAKDQIDIILMNFLSQLYKPEFLRFRSSIKSILLNFKYKINFSSRFTMLLNYSFLTLHSYKKKFIDSQKNG